MKNNYKEIKIFTNNTYGLNINENTFNDELIITENSIKCKRYFVVIDEYIMWKHTFLNDDFKDSFIKISEMIENLKEPIIAGCDTSLTTITLKYDDSEIDTEYTGSLTDNEMEDLSIELLKLIPSGCFYPDFIE